LATFKTRSYSSWQRGLNENHNGLLRQYFPKGMSLKDITQEQVDQAIAELNIRPRKKIRRRIQVISATG
jgi:IS30 family transposase